MVAVKRSGNVVGHVPKRISLICSSFLRRDSTITCRVTGTRRYSADLPQGGLEIPYQLIFRGKKSDLNKIEKLMKVAVKIDKPDTKSSGSLTKTTSLTNSQFKQSAVNITTSENPSIQIIKSPNMSVKVAESSNPSVKITTSSNPSIEITNSSNPSVEIADSSNLSVDIMKCVNPSINVAGSFTKMPMASNTSINNANPPDNRSSHSSTNKMCECIDLTYHISDPLSTTHLNSKFMPNDNELGRIVRGEQLTDLSIDCAQRMLKRQFPKLNGLNSTLLQQKNCPEVYTPDCLQIIHSRQSHWVVATTVRCNNNEVTLYDSMFREFDENTASVVYNLFNTRTVKIAKCQQQKGAVDCGLFSITFATSIAHGCNPTTVEYIQAHMRMHLVKCFSQGTLTLFPCK